MSGFTDAYKVVSHDLHSGALNVAFGVLIALTLVGSGAAWLQGADRSQAIAALDGAAPSWMGRFASSGTPIAVNLLSGVIGSAFVFFVFLITKGSLARFFSRMIVLAISATALGAMFVFPALVVLRRKYPHAHRPYRVPGGAPGAWVAVLLTWVVLSRTVASRRRRARFAAGHGRAQFGPRGHAQLAVGPGKIGLYSAPAQEQGLGNLAISAAGRGQDGDTFLGGGQCERGRRAEPDAGEL